MLFPRFGLLLHRLFRHAPQKSCNQQVSMKEVLMNVYINGHAILLSRCDQAHICEILPVDWVRKEQSYWLCKELSWDHLTDICLQNLIEFTLSLCTRSFLSSSQSSWLWGGWCTCQCLVWMMGVLPGSLISPPQQSAGILWESWSPWVPMASSCLWQWLDSCLPTSIKPSLHQRQVQDIKDFRPAIETVSPNCTSTPL